MSIRVALEGIVYWCCNECLHENSTSIHKAEQLIYCRNCGWEFEVEASGRATRTRRRA